jgi:tRNA-Thr(GGU) m(6)t(6)A37 methyltransferase TsaA
LSEEISVAPIGRVESELTEIDAAPLQGDEGAPAATLVLGDAFLAAAAGLGAGEEIIVLTWLDRGDRSVTQVHPRGDPSRPLRGVFATRSPDRPNPIGLHRTRITAVNGDRIEVDRLEALDGTPILDLKPVLSTDVGER